MYPFTELDEPWDEHTLKTEMKNLKSYQRQEEDLYIWLKAGAFALLDQCAPSFGLGTQSI